jgi:Rod binding domain-containing protein
LMMKELLKPMTSQSVAADTADNSEGSTGALGEFASEALAQAISGHGGFGIANRLLGELSGPAHSSGTGKTAEIRSKNSSLRFGQ